MADIKVIGNGQIFWRIDDGIAQLLLSAFPESFERYQKPAPEPPSPFWRYYVALMPYCGLKTIHRQRGGEVQPLDFHSSKTFLDAFPDCPADVIKQFESVPANERYSGRKAINYTS